MKAHWLALITLPGVGGVTTRKLLERFGSVEAIFDAPDEDLLRVPRITSKVLTRLRAVSLSELEAEITSLSDEGLHVITWDDAIYPANLKHVPDAPPVLFMRGDLHEGDAQAVAIVGTRQPTSPAASLADRLAKELADRGLTIVSGLAAGIDTAAHRGALQAGNGRTLAVLGSGLRIVHPRQNVPLAEEIVQQGALLSELAPNTPPRGASLMARDRIVSGLSRAVIVVEAAEKSGSLDTANKARRQGRLLFAVPGSPGTDALLASGAEMLQPQSLNFDRLYKGIMEYTLDTDEEQLRLW